ncbi:MAG: discoidin domain-containing protein [Armatimonadetes bacterium]|nr:discoidin domain-containing protein [Armatimonadota bacterium]
MSINKPFFKLLPLTLAGGVAVSNLHASAQVVPPTSVLGQADASVQRLLLSPVEADSSIHTAAWKIGSLGASPASADIAPRFGGTAMTLSGIAESGGAKGDFGVGGSIPGEAQMVGLWVYLAADANVSEVGFQINDSEGEALYTRIPADWQGWKWIEARFDEKTFTQPYAQTEKDKKVGLPIRNVNVIWFTKQAGPTALTIDGLVATTKLGADANRPSLSAQVSGAAFGEPNQPQSSQLLLTNFTATPITAEIDYSLQRNPTLFDRTPPHPIHGTDHALDATDWIQRDDKKISENTLTDNDENTAANAGWGKHTKEVFQYVDLGKERRVSHMTYLAGDANWVWNVDVSASSDGEDYQPVPGLQNLDWNKKWGHQEIKVPQRFPARYLRFRYHKNGETSDSFRMPVSLSVYDGVEDEDWKFPGTGEVIAQGTQTQQVGASSFEGVALKSDKALAPGAYLLNVRVRAAGQTQIATQTIFVMPPKMEPFKDSRFGLNASHMPFAAMHERLGIGWVRFENMKWQMISPAPGQYAYDGTVAPWNVPHDQFVQTYRKHGIQFLPFLFTTPDYASSAPADQKNKAIWPPKNPADYGDFVFQTVARYGSRKHPASVLKTKDKKTGLGWIDTYELWNEPNLINKDWGAWATTVDEYYTTILRPGAEAAKRADPTARVTNGGTAGIELDIIDTLRSFKYADGKMPLDFVDVLNAHFYTGRIAPELATFDSNVDRSGRPPAATDKTLEDHLRALSDWRDKNKPGMPIWITETGYDTGGPYGVSERDQAARLPRAIMLALGNGVEKVIVYREAGSTPSQHAASGVMRNDGALKPSWFSYATLIRELNGTQGGQRLPYPDPNVRLFAWPRGNSMVLSAWAINGAANLNLKLGQATITDSFGHRRRGVANQQSLSEFPIYIRDASDMNAVNALMEQARRSETTRKAELARQEKLRAYLFDFGSHEHIGTSQIGSVRRFTPVLADEIYNDTRGYGFTPKPSPINSDRHWVGSALNRDSVRLTPESQFQFRATPGRYRLRVGFAEPSNPNKLTLRGLTIPNRADTTFEFSKDKPTVESVVVVGNEPIVLESAWVDLAWLSMVQE